MSNGTQLAVDTFQRANENPLSDSGNWTAITGFSAPQIVSNICEPTAAALFQGVFWTGLTWASDQYSEITINLLTGSGNHQYIIVRSDANMHNCYFIDIQAGVSAILYKRVANTTTALVTISIASFASGSVVRLTALGSAIAVSVNGAYIASAGNAEITSGSAGFAVSCGTTLANGAITRWSGGSPYGNSGGVWTKGGPLLIPSTTDLNSGTLFSGISNQSVRYDSYPQLILANPDGRVFKMWFMGGNNIYYAESNTGLAGSWTRRSASILTGVGIPKVYSADDGATYIMHVNSAPTTWTQINQYTSSDGISWSLAHSNVLAIGGGGSWDATNVFYLNVMDIISGTWYGLYSGRGTSGYGLGLVTSSDGFTWSKSVSNPVLTNVGVPDQMAKVGSTYYGYVSHINVGQINATQGSGSCTRISTTDFVTYGTQVFSLEPDNTFEGLNTVNGETSVASVLEVGGVTYQFYDISPKDADSSIPYQIVVATAPYTIAQLAGGEEYFATYNETATDDFTRADENPLSDGGNWVTPTGSTALKLVSDKVECSALSPSVCSAAYTGTSFHDDQYAEATLAALVNSNSFFNIVVRSSSSATTYYRLNFHGPNNTIVSASLGKFVAGSFTSLGASVNINPQINDVFRISAVGNVISGFQNGALILQQTDYGSSISSGSPGLVFAVVSALTDVQVSSFAAGIADLPLPAGHVSGNTGVGNVTVSWTGPGSGSVTSDNSGNYTTPILPTGTYTITPSLRNYSFTPTSTSQAVSGTDVTGVDFAVLTSPQGPIVVLG